MSDCLSDFLLYTEVVDSTEMVLPEEQETELQEQDTQEEVLHPDGTYYRLIPEDVADYFAGYLDVNNDSYDYAAYGYREYTDGTYVDNYVLLYNLSVSLDGSVVDGEYPFVKIVQYDGDSTILYGSTSDVSVPDLAYGSYDGLSELRGGGVLHVVLAIFFAVCVAVCYNIFSGFFHFTK